MGPFSPCTRDIQVNKYKDATNQEATNSPLKTNTPPAKGPCSPDSQTQTAAYCPDSQTQTAAYCPDSQTQTAAKDGKIMGTCTECGTYACGDYDNGDLLFYCDRCWEAYDVNHGPRIDQMPPVLIRVCMYVCMYV